MPVMEIDRRAPAPETEPPAPSGPTGPGEAAGVAGVAAVSEPVGPGGERVRPRPRPEFGSWHPLAGEALLDRLRFTGRPRPRVDPDLARRLRGIVEQGMANTEGRAGAGRAAGAGVSPTGANLRLRLTKDRLTGALARGTHPVEAEFGERSPTVPLACGALVDVLFRQLVTVGAIGDPMADGLAGLSVDERRAGLVSWVNRLSAPDRAELRAEVERQTAGLLHRWPTLDPAWLPRTQETLRVVLAGGAVELVGRVDLAIGAPAADEASVAFVEIKSGARRPEHRLDLHFYALIEALRRPAPPFAVATYYTRTGELDVDPVTEEHLVAAACRVGAGLRRLSEPAEGAEPDGQPRSRPARAVRSFGRSDGEVGPGGHDMERRAVA
jgi:hypothetical protein